MTLPPPSPETGGDRPGPLKVLLVVPEFHQPIGLLARYIAQADPEIDFYFFTASEMFRRADEFSGLVRHVDVLHFLSNLNSIQLPPDIQVDRLPCPTVASVHHIEPGQDHKIAEASKANMLHVTAQEWVAYVVPRSDRPVGLAHQTIAPAKFLRNREIVRPGAPFRIGSFGLAGSLDGRKRLDVLLEALSRLKSLDHSFELVVQGPNWGNLVELFCSRGIPLRNLGFTAADNLWQAYRSIDLYVCTSDVEGGPLTVLEALASGVPVVSTPVGVAGEVLLLGGGLLVEKNDPAGVAGAIQQLVEDRELYYRLARQSPGAADRFSWVGIGPEYVSLYRNAIRAWEEQNRARWSSPAAIALPAPRQREKELAYARFREARGLKQRDCWAPAASAALKALGNPEVPLRDKLRGLRYIFQ